MAIGAIKLRSVQGDVRVALGQIEGIFSGLCKDTPEARQEALQMLRDAADVLQEEAKLVEAKQTPTIREWSTQGDVVFEGSVPFQYPAADAPVITKGAVEALAGMVK